MSRIVFKKIIFSSVSLFPVSLIYFRFSSFLIEKIYNCEKFFTVRTFLQSKSSTRSGAESAAPSHGFVVMAKRNMGTSSNTLIIAGTEPELGVREDNSATSCVQ